MLGLIIGILYVVGQMLIKIDRVVLLPLQVSLILLRHNFNAVSSKLFANSISRIMLLKIAEFNFFY